MNGKRRRSLRDAFGTERLELFIGQGLGVRDHSHGYDRLVVQYGGAFASIAHVACYEWWAVATSSYHSQRPHWLQRSNNTDWWKGWAVAREEARAMPTRGGGERCCESRAEGRGREKKMEKKEKRKEKREGSLDWRKMTSFRGRRWILVYASKWRCFKWRKVLGFHAHELALPCTQITPKST